MGLGSRVQVLVFSFGASRVLGGTGPFLSCPVAWGNSSLTFGILRA